MSQALEFGAVIIREPTNEAFEGLNRRSLHPIDAISRRLDFICTTATDALQIAAALESDGLNDRIAREEYGFSDVFELAEELFRRVPLRPPEYLLRVAEPHGRVALRCARGVLVVPLALMLPGLATAFGSRTLAIGAMVALAVAWIWALLVLPADSGLVSRGRDLEARRNLWISAGIAVLASVVVDAALTVIIHGRLEWIAAHLGLSLLLISGLVLISRSREVWLWLALAPGGLIAALGLSGGWPAWVGLVSLAASTVLTLGGAWLATLEDAEVAPNPDAGFTRPAWPAVALFGAVSFGVLALLPAWAWARGNAQAGIAHACALLPVLVGAGVLEWGIGGFRRWSVWLLSRASSPAVFVRRVRWGFVSFLAAALVVLAALSALDLRLCPEPAAGRMVGITLLAANAVLGLALAVSMILIGRNRVRELILPWVVTLGAGIAVLVLGWSGLALLNAFLGACALALVWTGLLAWRSLGGVAG